MDKKPKKKEGIARLMELAGTQKAGMTAACTLSVLSSVCKIVPFFTIYKMLQTLIQCFTSGTAFAFADVRWLVAITAASAVLYGVFTYASAMLSHGAAFDILYELRMKLMEKMGRISSGYYTSNSLGAIKKLLIEDVEQIEVFIAHSMCEVAAAIATPLLTIIVLFLVDWRLTLVSLLPILSPLSFSAWRSKSRTVQSISRLWRMQKQKWRARSLSTSTDCLSSRSSAARETPSSALKRI